jgi:N4-gp56 family major capsid protein
MALNNFPAALQPIIQQGFLEREFQSGIHSRLGFRAIADREEIPNKVGETVTKTRTGLKAPVTNPLNPSTNTNLDNGLTPSGWTVEQYSLSMNMFGDTIDLNMVTQGVGIAKQFMKNAEVNGVQAAQSLDRLARNALFSSYLGGNTRVRATLGAPALTLAVDDIRGYQYVLANGVMVPVSVATPMTVTVGAGVYTLSGAVADGSNVSTAPIGVSGVLTFTANVSVSDGTAGNGVVSSVGPSVLRPSSRASTSSLIATDLLTMQTVLSAVARLRTNNVPTINGAYNVYLDDNHLLELFQDGDFKLLYRGAYGSETYRSGQIIELLGARFITTTEAYQQTLGAVPIRRAIVCGQGALVEGNFASIGYSDLGDGDALKVMVDDICMVTREPLDRLQQIIAQSWYWIGGFAVPTDATANPTIIPTASNSYFKRAVVIESA